MGWRVNFRRSGVIHLHTYTLGSRLAAEASEGRDALLNQLKTLTDMDIERNTSSNSTHPFHSRSEKRRTNLVRNDDPVAAHLLCLIKRPVCSIEHIFHTLARQIPGDANGNR